MDRQSIKQLISPDTPTWLEVRSYNGDITNFDMRDHDVCQKLNLNAALN